MSGITGLYYRDGRQVSDKAIGRMMNSLSHRGPDGSRVHVAEDIALGHQFLRATRGNRGGELPHAHPTTGAVITADVRLDNRDELIRSLGLDAVADAWPDGRLILESYLKWGVDCADRLLGDYAFAIWDPRSREWYCARDPMGVKPFYYHLSDKLFAFGTEIRPLLTLEEIPRRINDLQVALYLERIIAEREMTFYEEVRRLPAAHWMTVSADRVRRERYWKLDPEKELKLGSEEEYVEAFREVFFRAVERRLDSPTGVGAALSGGMDSSSIVCTAREIRRQTGEAPIHTFSVVFPGFEDNPEDIDERPYIDAVLEGGDLIPHRIDGTKHSPLEDLEEVLRQQEEPHHGHALSYHRVMYREAKEAGASVFLEGIDGDSVVSYGFELLTELAYSGEWEQFVRVVEQTATRLEQEAASIARSMALPALSRQSLDLRLIRFVRGLRALENTYGASSWKLARSRGLGPWLARLSRSPFDRRREFHLVRPSVAQDMQLNKYKMPADDPSRSARTAHAEWVQWPQYQLAVELHDRAASWSGVDPRYPFLDRELIELCVGLPADYKLRNGWTRWIIRSAMSGLLPEKVQWRKWKSGVTANFHDRLIEGDRSVIDQAAHRETVIGSLCETTVSALMSNYESVSRDARSERDANSIFRLTQMVLWLTADGRDRYPG